MPLRNQLFFSTLLFIFSSFQLHKPSHYTASKDKEWKLKKYENGVAVYTRDAENSKFKELRAVVNVKTSLSSVVSLLNDWDSYPEWVYKCGKSLTLKRISEKEVIHYQTVVAPWPVDNRDFIVNVKLDQNEKTKIVTIHSTCKADYMKEFAGYVRIKEFKASWTLAPMKDGSVEVIYQLLVDPGGNVPAWMVNLAVVDGPYETLSHLKERVFYEKYQKAEVKFITN